MGGTAWRYRCLLSRHPAVILDLPERLGEERAEVVEAELELDRERLDGAEDRLSVDEVPPGGLEFGPVRLDPVEEMLDVPPARQDQLLFLGGGEPPVPGGHDLGGERGEEPD